MIQRLRRIAAFQKHKDTKAQSFLKLSMPLCLCGASILTLFFIHSAVAASMDSLQRQGVELYQKGQHEQALELFTQAVSQEPENALALYNQGTALYRLGNFAEAAQAFSASAHRDPHQTSRARAAYNQGRALLAEAGTNMAAAAKKELLLAGAHAFQQALRDDPGLTAARKGMEDFRREYAKLRDQPPPRQGQEQPPQGGQGQQERESPGQAGEGQGQQDLRDQLTRAGDQQQQMADQSTAAADGQNRQPPSPTERQAMAAQQQSVRQSLEQLKDELRHKQQGQADAPDSNDLDTELAQAIQAQKKAEEALKKGDLDQARQQQQQAADSLRQVAADQQDTTGPRRATTDSNDAEPPEQAGQAIQQVGEHDPAAAKTTATVADILDDEKALHEMRRLRRQQQRPASGKDW
jgi:tetratricopeptide (TPR) repeat protein